MHDTNARNLAVTEAIAAHKGRPGALLPLLHAIQDRLGCVPPETVPVVAQALNLSRADVHGVVTFYHHFRSAAPGKHVVKICRAEACQSMGADALVEHARKKLDVDFHGTSANGQFTLEAVYCLGNCACAPSAMTGDDLHGRLTPARLDAILAALEGAA